MTISICRRKRKKIGRKKKMTKKNVLSQNQKSMEGGGKRRNGRKNMRKHVRLMNKNYFDDGNYIKAK